MEWKKIKRILVCMVVVLLVSIIFSNVYADINEEYYKQNVNTFIVNETSESLVGKAISSVLLDAIGNLVYVLGSFGEWLIGLVFKAISSGNSSGQIFPWADAILFNAIPVLDINFINPTKVAGEKGSIVGILGDVIKNMYGTLFGLAISFFSIAVLIMGIKLAISTIASEKAKYKQALMDWFVGLLLLFTIHFFISFVFYLNEQLVNKASKIATEAINAEEAFDTINIEKNSVADKDVVDGFITAMESFHIGDILDGSAIMDAVDWIKDFDPYGEEDITRAKNYLNKNSETLYIARCFLENKEFLKHLEDRYSFSGLGTFSLAGNAWYDLGSGDPRYIVILAGYVSEVETGTYPAEVSEVCAGTSGEQYNSCYYRTMAINPIATKYIANKNGENSLIANLAQYFKDAAWTTEDNTWKLSKVVIQNALMYAILVVQSFIFLIAYVKRLFYVIILAMMAPLVVVYDFFNKSIS